MNIELEKSELIQWINQLKDDRIIHEFRLLMEKIQKDPPKRKFGSGKHIIKYVADDFNDAIDLFDAEAKS